MPILTLLLFSVDSDSSRNHCSCSIKSHQFCATFPVKESDSAGLQRIDIIAIQLALLTPCYDHDCLLMILLYLRKSLRQTEITSFTLYTYIATYYIITKYIITLHLQLSFKPTIDKSGFFADI